MHQSGNAHASNKIESMNVYECSAVPHLIKVLLIALSTQILKLLIHRVHLKLALVPLRQLVGAEQSHIPGVSSQGGVMQGIEPVVICNGDICTRLQQHRQHVVSLFAYGIVQGCVPFRILK